jgi:thiol-disulfide isomerase/thioredoxin
MNRVMLLMIAAATFGVAVSGCKTSQSASSFQTVQMKSLENNNVTVGDYHGKVVLVNFWATWCEPCKVEIPWLIEMQNKYSEKGFTVLGIAMDEEGKPVVAPFVAKQRYEVNGQQQAMNYPIVVGNEKVAEKFGGLLGYPTSVLISRDGKVLKRTTGLIDYDATTKMIEGAL